MRCFQHPDADAAALCPKCQKGLCHVCASQFAPMSCEQCFGSHNRRVAFHHVGRLIMTAVAFAGGTAFFASQHLPDRFYPVTMGAAAVAMLWGWMTIADYSSRGTIVVASPGLWLVFAMIKLVLSGFVGLVAAPIGIGNSVVQLFLVARTRRASQLAERGSGVPREPAPANTPAAGI